MATATSTNRHLDDVIRIIFFVEKISKEKNYREQTKNEVAKAICALLNSNGGKVVLRGEETKGNLVSTTILASFTRTLEQSSKSRLGDQITDLVNISGDKKKKMITITVTKARFLVTLKYNLYQSTQQQVEIISNVPNAFKIMNRKFVDQPVQLGSHQKAFLKGQDCGLEEKENIQFKHLKSFSSKRVTLADRMTGKSNKFSCYVSAFANRRGGHIYYGIDDNGNVRGEKTEEKSKIKKKVEKAIQNIIWPDTIGRPKQGKHWEIFFEPVLDENSNPIPSTFVIVIFIAPCFGGVFTEEPESYEMAEGKVERMSFTTWKEKLQPVGPNKRKQEVPSTIKRVSLSPATKKRCIMVNNALTEAMSDGDWESFARCANKLELQYPNNREVKLVVLSRRVQANYRRGYISDASILLNKFQECFPRAEQPLVSEMVFLFLSAVLARVSGKTAESRGFSTDGLAKAGGLEPGLITTIPVCLVAASTYDDSQQDAGLSPDLLSIMAIEHLEHVKDASMAHADMFHTAHITLAAYYLGYNLSGKVIKRDIDKESFERAQASIMAVNRSICDGNPLTGYREIWFTLSQSILYVRHSQFEPENQTKFLKTAFHFAKKAENLARGSGLVEMLCWAQTTIASCTEVLILGKLTRMKNIKVYKAQKKV